MNAADTGEAGGVARRFQLSMRRHRLAAGLTFAAMGERVGMLPQSVHRLETQDGYVPHLDTAHMIASFFGEDLSAFINAGVDKPAEGR